MKNAKLYIPFLLLAVACGKGKNEYDASGTFEAEELIISSEVTGQLKEFLAEEGQTLKEGEYLGYIDSVQLYLRKQQLQAQVGTTLSQRPDVPTQLAALQAQLKAAEKEQKRISSLVKADAATQKQLDDVNAQVEVLHKQLDAQQSALGITTRSINQQTQPLHIQIEQVEDQLRKCKLTAPINGTLLTRYVEANEMAVPGKALYKMADMSHLVLRAYVTSDQLAKLKLHQQVTVLADDGSENYKEYKGEVQWVSDKAEFTPKTIQTKEERANLVYAVKVRVKNDGYLKIGMYADLKF